MSKKTNKINFSVFGVLALIIISVVLLSGCVQKENPANQQNQVHPTSLTSTSNNIVSIPAGNQNTTNTTQMSETTSNFPPQMFKVVIYNSILEPQTINIKTGTTIVWLNADSVNHIVKSEGIFESPLIKKGESFNHTFRASGIIDYVLETEAHTSIKGQIIVQ